MATERKVYRRRGNGYDNHKLETESIPKPGPGQALLRIHAVSLNYRDLMIAKGEYGLMTQDPIIPLSDGAGEVIEAGEGVTEVKKGDRVMPNFMSKWIGGDLDGELFKSSLSGLIDGVAGQYIIMPANSLVKIPEHLSYEEASTLPCAALTAWNALFEGARPLLSGETVLIEGTGGVSVFGIQFAKAAGARVIVTSSSDEKLKKAKELGAHETINYKTNPEWAKEALRLTNGLGVDYILEVGGKDTTKQAAEAIKMGGYIYVIGGVSGFDAIFTTASIVFKAVNIRGILIGSRQMFNRMADAISVNKIKPSIDKVFDFDKLPEALRHLESGSHFGKVVVKVQ